MTGITSMNPKVNPSAVQTEKQVEPKSSLKSDLVTAVKDTLSWSIFAHIGEVSKNIVFGSDYERPLTKELHEAMGQCLQNNTPTICSLKSLPPWIVSERQAFNVKIAAEFMLATKLSSMALKYLGFEPSAPKSIAAGLAATILLNSATPATTFLSQTVITPIIGIMATAGVIVGIPLGLMAAFKFLNIAEEEIKSARENGLLASIIVLNISEEEIQLAKEVVKIRNKLKEDEPKVAEKETAEDDLLEIERVAHEERAKAEVEAEKERLEIERFALEERAKAEVEAEKERLEIERFALEERAKAEVEAEKEHLEIERFALEAEIRDR